MRVCVQIGSNLTPKGAISAPFCKNGAGSCGFSSERGTDGDKLSASTERLNPTCEVEQKPRRTVILSAAKDLRSPFGPDTYEQLQRSFAALRMTEAGSEIPLHSLFEV